MNVQILPNWCKKVGVILFLLWYLIGGIEPFLEGARDNFKKEHFTIEKKQTQVAYEDGKQTTVVEKEITDTKTVLTYSWGKISRTVAILLLLITLFSKEKREDEFISLLRLQSFHIAAIICLILSLLLSYFDTDSRVYIEDIAFVYIILYLIIFKIKKERLDLIE